MTDKFKNIEVAIWENIANEKKIGLLNGLSGVALFYDAMFEAFAEEEYAKKLTFIISNINDQLEKDFPSLTYCSGLAGYGVMLLKINRQNIAVDEKYFRQIDAVLKDYLDELVLSDKYDMLHGSIGVIMYFIERSKNKLELSITQILNNFAAIYIEKLCKNLENVIVFNTGAEYGQAFFFGIAHGVAGHINFLTYLHVNVKSISSDITEALLVCINYLKSNENGDKGSQMKFPNLILKNSKRIIASRFSWCQGDLGISNCFINASVFLNNVSLDKEAIDLMQNTTSILFSNSGVNDYGICHGSAGLALQYFFASNKLQKDYSFQVKYWLSIIEKQTTNYTEFLTFNGSTYIKDISILDGLAGLGLCLLTVENKIDSKWVEILYLH